MQRKYISEQLLYELPRPLINFIWYLWDTYYDRYSPAWEITLNGDDRTSAQIFIIQSIGKTVAQDFGCHITADIAIRKYGARIFMESH